MFSSSAVVAQRCVSCQAQKLQGTIVSTKCAKTATVAVERLVPHPTYGKRFKSTKNYIVHDMVRTKIAYPSSSIPRILRPLMWSLMLDWS